MTYLASSIMSQGPSDKALYCIRCRCNAVNRGCYRWWHLCTSPPLSPGVPDAGYCLQRQHRRLRCVVAWAVVSSCSLQRLQSHQCLLVRELAHVLLVGIAQCHVSCFSSLSSTYHSSGLTPAVVYSQVTQLAWGASSFNGGFTKTGELSTVLGTIRHGAEFIDASFPSPTVMLASIGNDTDDFAYYGPPEEYHQ